MCRTAVPCITRFLTPVPDDDTPFEWYLLTDISAEDGLYCPLQIRHLDLDGRLTIPEEKVVLYEKLSYFTQLSY